MSSEGLLRLEEFAHPRFRCRSENWRAWTIPGQFFHSKDWIHMRPLEKNGAALLPRRQHIVILHRAIEKRQPLRGRGPRRRAARKTRSSGSKRGKEQIAPQLAGGVPELIARPLDQEFSRLGCCTHRFRGAPESLAASDELAVTARKVLTVAGAGSQGSWPMQCVSAKGPSRARNEGNSSQARWSDQVTHFPGRPARAPSGCGASQPATRDCGQ